MIQKDKDFLLAMKRIDPDIVAQNKCQIFFNFINKVKNKLIFWK